MEAYSRSSPRWGYGWAPCSSTISAAKRTWVIPKSATVRPRVSTVLSDWRQLTRHKKLVGRPCKIVQIRMPALSTPGT